MLSKFKLFLLGCIIAVLVVLGGVVWFQHNDIKDLSKTNTEQAGQIQRTEAAKVLDDKSQAVTEQVQNQTVQEVEKSTASQEAIDQEVERRVAEIKRQYAAKPASPQATVERDDAVVGARIDGLWKLYCGGVQDEASCPK